MKISFKVEMVIPCNDHNQVMVNDIITNVEIEIHSHITVGVKFPKKAMLFLPEQEYPFDDLVTRTDKSYEIDSNDFEIIAFSDKIIALQYKSLNFKQAKSSYSFSD